MSSQPRAIPAAPETPAQILRRLRRDEQRLADALLAAHHRLWPNDVPGQYTIVHRIGRDGKGKAKVQFGPPQVKEPDFPE